MDPSDLQPSPRRELQIQGRRPSPLSVSKDSYRIRKPPIAPPPRHPTAEHQPPPQPLPPPRRDPVIIYSVSPKIIHATPSEFMTLVQRLTGPEPADPDPPSLPSPGGALSPAARIASFERPSPRASAARSSASDLEMDGLPAPDRQSLFPGILTPMPAALPPISPNLFSPSFDLSFLFELSPAFANKNPNNLSNTFLASPSNNLLSTPSVPSPGAFWDLMSQFPDSL
ncbi:protein MKS1-like [Curcuma longa]|uniref:protein MKS1-like n=1 Tax=Curcuma longa TaxID=136217 RepID=UPI003D9E72F6